MARRARLSGRRARGRGLRFTYGARTSNDIRLPGTETQAATDFLARQFPPQQNGLSQVVFHVEDGTLEEPAVKRAVQETLRRVREAPHVTSATSPYARGASEFLLSADRRTGLAQVLLDLDGGAVTREVAALRKRGAALEEDAAALERERRRLERRVDRAKALK